MWQIFKSHFTAAHDALKIMFGPMLSNTAYHQSNKMADELNTNFTRIRDEVLTVVHALVESQFEVPPVKAFQ